MTILLCANNAHSLYNFRGDVIQVLLKEGYTIIASAPYDKKYAKLLEDIGCKFIPIAMSAKGTNPFADLKLCFHIIQLLKKEHIDFAFFYTIKPNIYGSIASRFCRIPHIAVTTGLGYTFINDNLVARISKLLYKIAFLSPKEVWFLNKDDYQAFIQKKLIKPQKARIIPGEGINLDYFAPQSIQKNDDEPFTFLLIARMLYDKGVKEFYEAAQEVKKTYPRTCFILLGQADALNPSAVSTQILQEWQNSGVIEWHDAVEDVRPFIAQADCVVLPSYREGLPRTLLEAAAMEKPLIASDVPGCHDLIDDGKNGFLCEVKSSISLATRMAVMLQLSSLDRTKMATLGRQKMYDEFDIHIIIKIYLDTLRGLE